MNRETRANLIFIALFLGISLPGAVILFKKKLQPGSTAVGLGMPEYVRRRLPYMVPLQTPDNQVTRVIPPLTGAWVTELHARRGRGAPLLMNGPVPVTSGDRVVQVTGMLEEGGGTRVFVLAWEGYGAEAGGYKVTATAAGGETFDGRVVVAESVPMPQPVKKELMQGGYIKPSPAVAWLEVAFDAPLAGRRPLTLRIGYEGTGARASTAVNIPGD